MADGTTADHRALLDALLSGHVSSILERLDTSAEPELSPVPAEVPGFRLRLDLRGAKPPVWRRLELPGDLTLPRVHEVIQAAMGWTDSHLHRFRTGQDHRSAYFVTAVDLDEGEDGVLEDDVRLDQLVGAEGDAIWYEYDFGDGWDHVLKIEAGRLTEAYQVLLNLVGDGVALTSAGYLPPRLVEQFAKRAGITTWWIGKANREDLTPPVAVVRDTARALGLGSVRKGRLAQTAAGVRTRHDPHALLQHIIARLPLGTKDFDRNAGWLVTGTDLAVAATARTVIRRG